MMIFRWFVKSRISPGMFRYPSHHRVLQLSFGATSMAFQGKWRYPGLDGERGTSPSVLRRKGKRRRG